jgi:hypothetical protein
VVDDHAPPGVSGEPEQRKRDVRHAGAYASPRRGTMKIVG